MFALNIVDNKRKESRHFAGFFNNKEHSGGLNFVSGAYIW